MEKEKKIIPIIDSVSPVAVADIVNVQFRGGSGGEVFRIAAYASSLIIDEYMASEKTEPIEARPTGVLQMSVVNAANMAMTIAHNLIDSGYIKFWTETEENRTIMETYLPDLEKIVDAIKGVREKF